MQLGSTGLFLGNGIVGIEQRQSLAADLAVHGQAVGLLKGLDGRKHTIAEFTVQGVGVIAIHLQALLSLQYVRSAHTKGHGATGGNGRNGIGHGRTRIFCHSQSRQNHNNRQQQSQ